VEKVAKNLKNKLSAGTDDIPDCFKTAHTTFKEMSNIYNTSLESGIFPDQLKVAEVIPLYKKEDKNYINNYRSIALLEKLMYNRLMTFLEGNEVLIEAEHGFRMKKSTETALQYIVKSTQEATEKKMNPVGIF
jgi:hypothetical protein